MRLRLDIRERIASAWGRLSWPMVRALSQRREHHGFLIASFLEVDEGKHELAAARVALALDLIAAFDRRRLERIRHDMPRIRVIAAGGGLFESHIRACVLDWNQVAWQPIARLATIIVHEATHARFHRVGIGYPDHWQRRIERRCILEEVAFLSRLPDHGALAAERRAELESLLDTEWWAPHRTIERSLEQARALGFPWLIRHLERRRARLLRESGIQDG